MTSRVHVQYALDANVLITAYRTYYAPDLCPGFWECLAHHLGNGRLVVIDRVRDEIKYPPGLKQWVHRATDGVLATTAARSVVGYYSQMMGWVKGNSQFTEAAGDEFGRVADGWLAAYAKANRAVVVTQEVDDPNSRKRVPLPNLCRMFDVTPIDTFGMLKELDARFDWSR